MKIDPIFTAAFRIDRSKRERNPYVLAFMAIGLLVMTTSFALRICRVVPPVIDDIIRLAVLLPVFAYNARRMYKGLL